MKRKRKPTNNLVQITRINTKQNSKYNNVEIEYIGEKRLRRNPSRNSETTPTTVKPEIEMPVPKITLDTINTIEADIPSSPSQNSPETLEFLPLPLSEPIDSLNLDQKLEPPLRKDLKINFNPSILINKFKKDKSPAEVLKTSEFKHNSKKGLLRSEIKRWDGDEVKEVVRVNRRVTE